MSGPRTWFEQPACAGCDDQGCPECCETYPVTEDDIDQISTEIAQSEKLT